MVEQKYLITDIGNQGKNIMKCSKTLKISKKASSGMVMKLIKAAWYPSPSWFIFKLFFQ